MTAIKSIKNNKSPGSGKTITVELLKYRGDSLHSAVLEITDGVLNQTETPKQWRGNIIIPIPKKASKHMKDLIPLITLMPIAGKCITKYNLIAYMNQLITSYVSSKQDLGRIEAVGVNSYNKKNS